MPDLITHITFSYFLKRPFEIIKKTESKSPLRILFYLGAILPDLLTRPVNIIYPAFQDWIICIHTPLVMLMICGIIALLFEYKFRKSAFFLLSGGVISHFLLDTFQAQLVSNHYLLFPFSWHAFGFYLFDAGDIIPFIPVWIIFVVFLELIILKLIKK